MLPLCLRYTFRSPIAHKQLLLVRANDGERLCRDGGHEALAGWRVDACLDGIAGRDMAFLREFALRTGLSSVPVATLSDAQLVGWFKDALRRRALVILQEAEGGATKESDGGTRKQRQLIKQIASIAGRKLSHAGRNYRLVADVDLTALADRDRYEVVRRADAAAVLAGLAKEGKASPALTQALEQATTMLAPDWRPPLPPNGIVLLRRTVVAQATPQTIDAPITPSQMKAMLKKTDWIEIEVLDEQGKPYPGAYVIDLPDGRSIRGTFDDQGLFGNYDIEPGTCKLVLPRERRVVPSDADAGPAPAESGPSDETPPELEDLPTPPATPVVEEKEFLATLVDHLGQPVAGVALVFTHAGVGERVMTDAAGVARHRAAGPDSFEVGFESPAALALAMTPVFSECRGIARDAWVKPDATTTTVAPSGGTIYKVSPGAAGSDAQVLQPFASATTSEAAPATLSVQPLVVVARLLAKHFDLNKCFLLPTALSSPQEIVRLQREYNEAEILVTGHTDTSSTPDYNLELSVERATAMRDYLTNNVDGWLAWYNSDKSDKKRWGSTEDTSMIGSLVASSGYAATVLGYQQWHNAAAPPTPVSEALKEDGIIGPTTRRQLVADYMNREGTTVPEGTIVEVHGCGEYFPLDASGTALDTSALDGQREPEDRRVEVYFFPKEFGILPPVPGPKATKDEAEYPEWRGRSTTVTFVAAPTVLRVDVRLTDELDEPLAGIPLVAGGTSVTTDADGVASWPGAGLGTVVRLADEAAAATILRERDPSSRRTTPFPTPSPTQHVVSLAQLAAGVAAPPGAWVHIMLVLRSHLVHTVESTRWSGLSLEQPGPWQLDQAKLTSLSMLNAARDDEVVVDKTSDADLALDTGTIAWLRTRVATLHEALLSGNFGAIWDTLRAIPLSVLAPSPTSPWPAAGAPRPGEAPPATPPDQPPDDLGRGGT